MSCFSFPFMFYLFTKITYEPNYICTITNNEVSSFVPAMGYKKLERKAFIHIYWGKRRSWLERVGDMNICFEVEQPLLFNKITYCGFCALPLCVCKNNVAHRAHNPRTTKQEEATSEFHFTHWLLSPLDYY